VYSREIDNNILTLSACGWTYDRTFVLYDYETESLWYHLSGTNGLISGTNGLTCISGKYADRNLEEFTSIRTRWGAWSIDHQGSKVLKYGNYSYFSH
jgi:hypothetical protein